MFLALEFDLKKGVFQHLTLYLTLTLLKLRTTNEIV